MDTRNVERVSVTFTREPKVSNAERDTPPVFARELTIAL